MIFPVESDCLCIHKNESNTIEITEWIPKNAILKQRHFRLLMNKALCPENLVLLLDKIRRLVVYNNLGVRLCYYILSIRKLYNLN